MSEADEIAKNCAVVQLMLYETKKRNREKPIRLISVTEFELCINLSLAYMDLFNDFAHCVAACKNCISFVCVDMHSKSKAVVNSDNNITENK